MGLGHLALVVALLADQGFAAAPAERSSPKPTEDVQITAENWDQVEVTDENLDEVYKQAERFLVGKLLLAVLGLAFVFLLFGAYERWDSWRQREAQQKRKAAKPCSFCGCKDWELGPSVPKEVFDKCIPIRKKGTFQFQRRCPECGLEVNLREDSPRRHIPYPIGRRSSAPSLNEKIEEARKAAERVRAEIFGVRGHGPCTLCGGKGWVVMPSPAGAEGREIMDCPACGGRGRT